MTPQPPSPNPCRKCKCPPHRRGTIKPSVTHWFVCRCGQSTKPTRYLPDALLAWNEENLGEGMGV